MKKNILCQIIFLLLYFTCYSQETTANSGGNATGSNGSTSYTIGQVIYTTNNDTSYSVASGVQQPFEIQPVLGIENQNINLKFTVYPNPTTNKLLLDIVNYDFNNLKYVLLDTNGKQILSNKISTESTSVSLEEFPESIYFLKILKNNEIIKTFKIIKK